MSFLQALQKKKSNLKRTDTLVKTAGGDVLLEKRDRLGEVIAEKVATTVGFVVDLKPDLQVASVLSGLYMGSQDVTQDENILREFSITYILSVGVQVSHISGIKYIFLEALDLPEFDMMTVFQQSSKIINEVREAGGAIFVHCNAGVSRSAAIVLAYLMIHKNLSYQQSFDMLKEARPCIKPNEGFVKQLKLLESKLFCNK